MAEVESDRYGNSYSFPLFCSSFAYVSRHESHHQGEDLQELLLPYLFCLVFLLPEEKFELAC